MEQPKLLKELIHQIKDNKLLSNHGNMARTSGINGGENNKAGANDEGGDASFTIGRYNKRGCNVNGGSYCNGLQSHGGTT
jgi:hypothetical protein